MWNSELEGERVRNYFASLEGDTRYIFAPFIQKQALQEVIPKDDSDTVIVTRWKVEDLVSGVSDPEVFEVCQERGYTLMIHPRIHAKVYSWDLDIALVGSANLTASGMGINKNPNIEVLSTEIQLTQQTQFKLREVLSESKLVTRVDYENATEYLENNEDSNLELETLDLGTNTEFLTSQLPMTKDPNTIIKTLSRDDSMSFDDLDPEQQSHVLHDIVTFSLKDLEGKSRKDVREKLREKFLNHDFICAITQNMCPYIYFGEMKELVQNNCIDVPTPSRRELTGDIQILYQWFPKIAPDRFNHDIPGAHSERLCDSYKRTS